jgi:hypothetical protein
MTEPSAAQQMARGNLLLAIYLWVGARPTSRGVAANHRASWRTIVAGPICSSPT